MKLVRIRKATQKDIKELEKINKIANEELKWWVPLEPKFYKKLLRNKYKDCFLAFENNKLIGFLSLEYNKNNGRMIIEDIYVLSKMRARGIARKLINECVRIWKKKSKSIVLLTADKNLRIFERLGFKKTMNYMEMK